MAVGEKASVMTITEGRQVKPPGTMKKFFAEHKEGVQRVKDGFVPKWAIAGPKWPIKAKLEILKEFQGALAQGKLDLAKSYLTGQAIIKVGNRAEVSTPDKVLSTVGTLFTTELRPSAADFTAVWEPEENVLVVEMTVKATRIGEGKEVSYPCVETYRFQGDKISEWRIYPIEATLLAPESLAAQI
jgi:hypothetical protein